MKNFILGTVNTLILAQTLNVDVATLPPEVVEIIKVFISLIGGTISALLMALLKNKFPEIFKKKVK